MAKESFEEQLAQLPPDARALMLKSPKIKQLFESELFRTIKLTRSSVEHDLSFLEYDVEAPDIMPHPRARMLENGLVKRGNLLHSALRGDVLNQTIGFSGSSLQISLNFRRSDMPDKKDKQ